MRSLFLILLLSPLSLIAEYNGWFAEFEAIKKDGSSLHGFVYITSAYFEEDSAKNSSYLIRKLERLDHKVNDSILYFEHLIQYPVSREVDTSYLYTTIKPQYIPASQLDSVRILQRIEQSYIYILDILDPSSNLEWLKEDVQKEIHFSGYFCHYTLHIHRFSPEIHKVLNDLEEYERAYKLDEDELKADLQTQGGEYYRETRDKIEKLEESRDDAMREFIDRLKGEKVVLSGSCSC